MEVSSDNTDWTEQNVTGLNEDGSGTEYETKIKLDNKASARYLRITGTGESDRWWSVYELAVYDSSMKSLGVGESITSGSDFLLDVYTYPENNTKNATASEGITTDSLFSDEVSDDVKAAFGNEDGTSIASKYTKARWGFLGTQNTTDTAAAITDLDLAPGNYSLYILSPNSERTVTVTMGQTVGTASSAVEIASDMYVQTYDFTLTNTFAGDLIMSNSTGWLPDMYCVKLVRNADSEPDPQPETLNMKNEGVSTGNDGSVATSFTAQISNFSGYVGTPKTVTVTSGVNSMPIEINSTVIAEGNTIYALIVNGLNDSDAEAVITFE